MEGGYYVWGYCDDVVKEYVGEMICSEKCIKEVLQIFKQRRGIE
jgi:hypothetical protein